MQRALLLCLLLPFSASCSVFAAMERPEHPRSHRNRPVQEPFAEASAHGAAAQAGDSTGPMDVSFAPELEPGPNPKSTLPMNSWELHIWNDPRFQRQFVQSYLSETDIEPTVTQLEQETMTRVMEYLAADKMDRAVDLLEQKNDVSATAVFDYTLANIHFQRDQIQRATAGYEAAVEKFPAFRRAWRNLGVIQVKESHFEEALVALTKVIELGGADAVTYGLLGFSYASVENHLAAESAYRMATLLDPLTPDWKMHLARSLFKQERFDDAAALCADLLAQEPERTDLWLLQANAYIGLGRPMDAAANYEVVDRLGASTPESLATLADIYTNEELYDIAVDTYIRAIDKSPAGSAERSLRAARLLVSRGALDDTSRLVTHIEAYVLDQLSADSKKDLLRMQARLALAEGAGEEEARILKEIVELDPLDGDALILLGQHAGRTGDVALAAHYFEQAAGIEEFEADAKLRHAQVLVGERRYAEALPLLQRAQLLKPRENIEEFMKQVEQAANR